MELLRERLGVLPATTRAALLLAAAASRPSEPVLAAAGVRPAALERAVEAGVVELVGDDVRFTHPLLAAAALADALPARRRAAHRRLAAVVADPEERARHLALAAASPSERVAAALDRAVEHAARRGATAAAAELAELAVTAGRTPVRVARAAELLRHSGDLPRARALLEAAIAEAPAGPETRSAPMAPGRGLGAGGRTACARAPPRGRARGRGRRPPARALAASLAGWIPATHEGLDAAEASADARGRARRADGDTATLARALALLGADRRVAWTTAPPRPDGACGRAGGSGRAARRGRGRRSSILYAEHLVAEDPALAAERAKRSSTAPARSGTPASPRRSGPRGCALRPRPARGLARRRARGPRRGRPDRSRARRAARARSGRPRPRRVRRRRGGAGDARRVARACARARSGRPLPA